MTSPTSRPAVRDIISPLTPIANCNSGVNLRGFPPFLQPPLRAAASPREQIISRGNAEARKILFGKRIDRPVVRLGLGCERYFV